MPRYEVSDGTAHKFWEITLAGKTFTVRSGRLGTRGRSAVTHFDDDTAARREYDKLVEEKVRRGYKLVDGIEEPPADAIATTARFAHSPELEAAVIANPNDEAALLVLGDWLQVQGDPRGELISLQHALRQASSEPKLFLERKRAAETYYKLHEPALLGPLYPLRHLFKLEWQLGYIRGAKLSLHAASANDPDLAELLRMLVDVPAAVALQELGFGVTRAGKARRGSGYQHVIDALADGKPPSLRSLALGEFWPGFDEPLPESVGTFAKLEGKFQHLRKLVLGARATMGAWALPELRHLELRATPDERLWRWVAARCPRLEYLDLESFPNAFEQGDGERLPSLRKLRLRSAGTVRQLAESGLLKQLENVDIAGIPADDAELVVERWSDFAHLKTVRLTINVPLQDDGRDSERVVRRLKTQTTAEITIHKYYAH